MTKKNAAAVPFAATCGSCHWFRVEFGDGNCFAAPPVLLMDAKGRVHTLRPTVDIDDVCAQWKTGVEL